MKGKNVLIILLYILSMVTFAGVVAYAIKPKEQVDTNDVPDTSLNQAQTVDNISPAAGISVTDAPAGNSTHDIGVSEGTAPTGTNINNASADISASPPAPGNNGISVTNNNSPTAAPKPIILEFAGDINLDEDSYPVKRYDRENKGISGCISSELVDDMNSADIMMLNNEFAYSLRGTEEKNKSYTFRADPGRVDILKEMGVDIVSLANNHALDYGKDALYDTFDTLDNAGIDYVGAGDTLNRAKAPVYYTVGDRKIAYLAASRVVFEMHWYASDTEPGMLGTYDPSIFLDSVKEASDNSDFVIVYVHWGIERTDTPAAYQRKLAKQYIDAGADAVIGCHPHVLQGLEFYKGKLIAYSLGNFWFNKTKREAGLLKLYLNPDGTTLVKLLPTMGEDTYTYLLGKEADRTKYFNYMEDISFKVNIDKDGNVTDAK